VLYSAAERVLAVAPDVRFVLAGLPGIGFVPPAPGVESAFSFVGRLTASEVLELMRHAAVLVSPGVWPEPLSRVLLEAMSVGLPIVATTVGGNEEAVEHQKSAWMVPPDDGPALADGIVRILKDPLLAARLAHGARGRFRELFSPQAIVPQILEVYERACIGRGRSR
jgi:glycosyltransferase involved in cell wall biosynthesis